jgi:hypothetical protein
LFTLGYRGTDLINFDLAFNNPSKVAEMQNLETWRAKFSIAQQAGEDYFSKRWVAKTIFGMSEDEILRNIRERFYDAKLNSDLEKIADSGQEGGMGDLVGGGAEEDLEPQEIPEEEMDLGAAEEEGMEEPTDEETLLAAPARRDDEVFVKMSRSKLKPGDQWTGSLNSKNKMNVKGSTDKRNAFGPRKKNMSMGEKSRKTKRNVFPGTIEMGKLSKGIMENKNTNYEERKILEISQEVKTLLEGLEERNNKKKESN